MKSLSIFDTNNVLIQKYCNLKPNQLHRFQMLIKPEVDIQITYSSPDELIYILDFYLLDSPVTNGLTSKQVSAFYYLQPNVSLFAILDNIEFNRKYLPFFHKLTHKEILYIRPFTEIPREISIYFYSQNMSVEAPLDELINEIIDSKNMINLNFFLEYIPKYKFLHMETFENITSINVCVIEPIIHPIIWWIKLISGNNSADEIYTFSDNIPPAVIIGYIHLIDDSALDYLFKQQTFVEKIGDYLVGNNDCSELPEYIQKLLMTNYSRQHLLSFSTNWLLELYKESSDSDLCWKILNILACNSKFRNESLELNYKKINKLRTLDDYRTVIRLYSKNPDIIIDDEILTNAFLIPSDSKIDTKYNLKTIYFDDYFFVKFCGSRFEESLNYTKIPSSDNIYAQTKSNSINEFLKQSGKYKIIPNVVPIANTEISIDEINPNNIEYICVDNRYLIVEPFGYIPILRNNCVSVCIYCKGVVIAIFSDGFTEKIVMHANNKLKIFESKNMFSKFVISSPTLIVRFEMRNIMMS